MPPAALTDPPAADPSTAVSSDHPAEEARLLSVFRGLPAAARRSLTDYAAFLAARAETDPHGDEHAAPRGTPGQDLEEFFGALSPEAADAIERAIEEQFGQISHA